MRNQRPQFCSALQLPWWGSQMQLTPCGWHQGFWDSKQAHILGKASFLFFSTTLWFSVRYYDTAFILHKPRLFPRNVNYITSWLSIVGPVVGLNLPLSYAKATLQDEWFVDEQGNEQSLGACFLVRKMMVSLLPLATPRVWGQFALSLLGWVLAGSSAFQLFERCLPCYKGTHTTAGGGSFYVMANILEIRLYCPPLFSLLLSYCCSPRNCGMENTKSIPGRPRWLWKWDCGTSCHQDLMQISFLEKKTSADLFGTVFVWKEHITDSDHCKEKKGSKSVTL